MTDHYFSAAPQSAHEDRHFTFGFAGRTLRFQTDAGVFSKQHVDPGSELLCRCLPEDLAGDVLDMGCGWGAMTVMTLAAHPAVRVTMADVNARALELAKTNLALNGMTATAVLSDGFSAVGGLFDAVITNPPIRAGKQVVYGIFEGAKAHLKAGGALYAVVRKQQGAPSALSFLKGIYREAEVVEKDGGYWILAAKI
ncbi:MAG: class I SAM-dependent methyltransferase [Clostridia bacterium]|nr:class I SAM-dependent methyltransferase [Clostridia bacterium]